VFHHIEIHVATLLKNLKPLQKINLKYDENKQIERNIFQGSHFSLNFKLKIA